MEHPRLRTLILGGTGQIGLPVALALASEGHQVFAVVRPSSRTKNAGAIGDLEAAGVKLIDGDIGLLDTLHAAFEKLHPIEIVVSAVAGPQVLLQSNLIEAISKAGTVQRFLPSEYSVDIPRAHARLPFLFEPRLAVMKQVKAVGIPYTVITSNGFLEDWFAGLGQLGPKEPPTEITIFGSGDVKGVATTREDIAAYTAKAVADPRTLNKRLIIQPAKNVLTQTELVNLWESISGQQVSRQYMSAEDLQGAIKGASSKASGNYDEQTYLLLQQSFWILGDAMHDLPPDGLEATHLYPEIAYTSAEDFYRKLWNTLSSGRTGGLGYA